MSTERKQTTICCSECKSQIMTLSYVPGVHSVAKMVTDLSHRDDGECLYCHSSKWMSELIKTGKAYTERGIEKLFEPGETA